MEKNIQRDQARELFLQTELKQAEIAHLLNVNRKTVGLWIQQGKWREMKQTALQAPGIVLQELYNQLSCLNAAINSRDIAHRYPTLEESTIQRRLMMSIKSFEWQSAGNYMQTYTELINEIATGDLELSREVCHYADDIIRRKYNRDKKTSAQYMFLTDDADELDELDKEDSIIDDKETNIPPIPGAGTNETSCDIQNSQITQPEQPVEENIELPMSPNNIPEKRENTAEDSDKEEEIKLPNGVILVNSTTVYDPILGRNRQIKIGEVDQFLKMGYGKYLR